MAEFAAVDLVSRAMHLGEFGNMTGNRNYATPTAAAVNDIIVPTRIPAGFELWQLELQVPVLDSDSTPTLQATVGYRPVDSTVGPAVDDDYFSGAAANFGHAASRVRYDFVPIMFEYDVDVIVTVTTGAATFASGDVWGIAIGDGRGVK